ncbi:MAG: DUF3737 family protein [Bacteroidales bacterium]|nr:DUF3737 family protein [Bacteroidales bacterium]
MEKIVGKEFGGERPLYCKNDLYLENVIIHAGESALKETARITAEKCRFEGKYPLWECDGFVVRDSILTVGARSGLWYSRNGELYDTIIDAPKTFRRMDGIKMRNCWIPGGTETFWDCKNIDVEDCVIERADYVFMHCENIRLKNVKLQGNYGFQYAKNVVIENCVLNSKDSFWEAENVVVRDSVINGEYLAWYSKNVKLERCHISETQPLCYCDGLVLEDCTFADDADLVFEYSEVEATVNSHIVSVKNPRTGHIHARSIGEIIIDGNIKGPGDCVITTDYGKGC